MKIHAPLPSATAAFLHRARRRVPGLLALALLPCIGAPAARAVTPAPKIFVASTGSDANTGAQNAPKRTFAAALGAVQAGGDIVALDTTNYGGAVITQGVTITAAAGATAFITVSGSSNGITIRTGTADVVNLSGLVIEGSGITNGAGIYATAVGTLRVENCKISGFGFGLLMATGNNAHLLVSGSSVRDVLDGIYADPTAAGVMLTATVTGCVVDGATGNALLAFPKDATASAILTASHCVLSHNNTGLYTNAGGLLVADDCTVCDSQFGVGSGGGTLISRGTNTFFDNNMDGNFDQTLTAK